MMKFAYAARYGSSFPGAVADDEGAGSPSAANMLALTRVHTVLRHTAKNDSPEGRRAIFPNMNREGHRVRRSVSEATRRRYVSVPGIS
jgi:hypothetical protein